MSDIRQKNLTMEQVGGKNPTIEQKLRGIFLVRYPTVEHKG